MSESAGREQFFERCPSPAAIVGFDGRIAEANGAWQDLTGWSRAELVGRPLTELLHPDDVAPTIGEPAALERGELAGTWEGRVVGRDGSAAWLSWSVGASHSRRLYYCIARHLTAEEMRRQERFKANFINMAAHELNTPLTPIQLALDTLAMRIDPVLGREAHQSVEMVRRNFLRFKGLVSELLDAARMHAGRLPLNLQEADLSALVLQAIEARRDAGAAIRSEVEPGLRAVVDPERLLQVLDNHLACCLASTPPGGEVRVEARRRDREAVVSASCPGASLTPEQRERLVLLFPPDEPLPGQRGGSGLGLYLARGIVQLHGGRMVAQADDGLTLTFALPLDGPRPAQAAQAEQAAVRTEATL
jgi:PAS domain S-box-containing protein